MLCRCYSKFPLVSEMIYKARDPHSVHNGVFFSDSLESSCFSLPRAEITGQLVSQKPTLPLYFPNNTRTELGKALELVRTNLS